MRRAAIYCRVSTSRQAGEDKASLGDQEERCRSICETKGWEVVGVYDEGDASGGTVHRGEFQRLIADARAGNFDVIVVREVSRLSRVAQARRAVEELMIEWGLAVCNARTGIVYSEGEGLGASVIWTIEAKMAEAELAERSFRTTMGKNKKAAKGLVPSAKAPYGYRWSGGEGNHLVVDEDKADIVEEIFRLVAVGMNCPDVAQTLNLRGVQSPGGDTAGWRSTSVHRTVTSRAYIGEHEYGRYHYRKLNSERDRADWARNYFSRTGRHPERIPLKVREARPVGSEGRFAVILPPLVERDLWERANQKLARTKSNRRPRPQRVMMLQGLLRCEVCGQPMGITWAYKKNVDKFYSYYRCNSHETAAGRLRCRQNDVQLRRSINVVADAIEGEVWQLIDEMLSDPSILASAIGAKLDEMDARSASQDKRIERHQRRLEESRSAWEKARRLHFADKLGDADYERDRAFYEREIRAIEDELRRMRAAEDQREVERHQASDIELLSGRWAEIRDRFSQEEKREIVWALVSDVTISPDNEVTVSGALPTMAGWTDNGVVPPAGLEPAT